MRASAQLTGQGRGLCRRVTDDSQRIDLRIGELSKEIHWQIEGQRKDCVNGLAELFQAPVIGGCCVPKTVWRRRIDILNEVPGSRLARVVIVLREIRRPHMEDLFQVRRGFLA